jgi:hypothetical protein
VLGKSLLGGTLISFLALTTLDQTLGLSQKQASPARTANSARPASHGEHATTVPTAAAVASVAATSVPEPSPRANPGSVTDNRRGLAWVSKPSPVAQPGPVDQPPARAAFAPLTQPQIAAGASAAASASLTAEIRLLDQARAALAAEIRLLDQARAALAAEIRLLDQARAALAAGETVTAGRLLDAYASNRPSAVLTQEAGLLQIKLLLARGQRSAAAEHARRIIALHPESAHVDSLRRLAAEP